MLAGWAKRHNDNFYLLHEAETCLKGLKYYRIPEQIGIELHRSTYPLGKFKEKFVPTRFGIYNEVARKMPHL